MVTAKHGNADSLCIAEGKKTDLWKIGEDFYCPKCKFIQRSVFYFDHHMETGHKTSLLLCFKCNSTFENETELEEHCLKKHLDPENYMFLCYLCPQIFEDILKLDAHIKLCHGPECASFISFGDNKLSEIQKAKAMKNIFSCSLCTLSFNTQTELDEHTESNHPVLHCLNCKFSTRSSFVLHHHLQHVHMFRCRGCNVFFVSLQQLKDHIKASQHSQTQFRNKFDKSSSSKKAVVERRITYPCSKCSEKFTELKQVQTHMDVAHHRVVSFCKICEIAFSEEQHLQAHHVAMHVPKKSEVKTEVPFKCSVCSSKFDRLIDLNKHIKATHPLIKCLSCSLSLRYPEKVRAHMKNIHKEDFHLCNACFLGFKSKELLDNHTEEFHNQSSNQKEIKSFGKAKAVRSRKTKGRNLGVQKLVQDQVVVAKQVPLTTSESVAIDTSFKAIPCSVCSIEFGCRADLIKHIDDKHPVIKCLVCPLSFRSTEKVASHMKNIHQQEYQTESKSVSAQKDQRIENAIRIVETESENREYDHETFESSYDPLEPEVDIIEIDEKFILEEEVPITNTNGQAKKAQSGVDLNFRIQHDVFVIEECEMIAVDECDLN